MVTPIGRMPNMHKPVGVNNLEWSRQLSDVSEGMYRQVQNLLILADKEEDEGKLVESQESVEAAGMVLKHASVITNMSIARALQALVEDF